MFTLFIIPASSSFNAAMSGLAYLDPGSGSFILQILLAALLGSMFVLRSFWAKVVNFFRKGSTNPEKSPDSQDEITLPKDDDEPKA